jgi:hypothetical protein
MTQNSVMSTTPCQRLDGSMRAAVTQLREGMSLHGYTLRSLGEAINRSYGAIAHYLAGRAPIDPGDVPALVKALKMGSERAQRFAFLVDLGQAPESIERRVLELESTLELLELYLRPTLPSRPTRDPAPGPAVRVAEHDPAAYQADLLGAPSVLASWPVRPLQALTSWTMPGPDVGT